MRFLAVALSFAAVTGACAAETSYPMRAVHILVPHAPGGPTDVMARVAAPRLAERWGQSVVVDNRAGAGGNIGTALVARTNPDGYTILCNSSAFAVNVSLFASPGYATTDFAPVINGGVIANLIFVHPSVPAKTLKELIALGKAKKLSYASAGMGTTPHLTAERLLKTMAKLDITHVPYNGAALAANAVLAGEVPVGSAAVTAPAPLIRAGRLRGIAVTSLQRASALPEVPTVAESGFPGYEDYTWIAFFVPRATPAAIVDKVNADMTATLQTAAVKDRLAPLGFEFSPNTPQQFAAYLKAEVAKWGKVVKDSGARVD